MRLQSCERTNGTARAARTSVGECEHVLAQSNVWEMKSEKQMAALRMGGVEEDREEGRVMMSQPTKSITCAASMFIYFTLSSTHPKMKLIRVE